MPKLTKHKCFIGNKNDNNKLNKLGLVRTLDPILGLNCLGIGLPVSHLPSCIMTTNPPRTGVNPLNIQLCRILTCITNTLPQKYNGLRTNAIWCSDKIKKSSARADCMDFLVFQNYHTVSVSFSNLKVCPRNPEATLPLIVGAKQCLGQFLHYTFVDDTWPNEYNGTQADIKRWKAIPVF